MNRDLELAYQANILGGFKDLHPDVAEFAKLIRADEREECARTSETVTPRHTECGNKIAAAIRARG